MKLALRTLDEMEARYVNVIEGVCVTLTRKVWQDSGKPTELTVTIEGSHE